MTFCLPSTLVKAYITFCLPFDVGQGVHDLLLAIDVGQGVHDLLLAIHVGDQAGVTATAWGNRAVDFCLDLLNITQIPDLIILLEEP